MNRNLKDLNENQREALCQFGRKVGSYLKADQDDYFLIKWLYATDFDVQKAEDMLRQSLWVRKKFDLDSVLVNYRPPEVLEKYDPGGFYGFGKEGHPIFVDPVGQVDFKGLLHSARREEVLRFKGWHAELGLQLAKEQSKKEQKRIENVVTILDMEGLGMKHLWAPGIALFNSVLTFYENNYPGFWKYILVIRAPALFPVAFNLVKPFLSECTKSRIKILGSDWKTELQQYVDEDNLPEYYGGKCRDENDDPKCSSKICYGGDIPVTYYLAQKPFGTAVGATVAVVERGKTLDVKREVRLAGATLRWNFRSKENDIGFGVYYTIPRVDDCKDKNPTDKKAEKNGPGLPEDKTRPPTDEKDEKDEPTDEKNKNNQPSETKKNGNDLLEEILPVQRVDSHFVPEEGSVTCDKPGTYVLRFDNSFSWIKSKDIEYKIEVLDSTRASGAKDTK